MIDPSARIHETAVIDDAAYIGANTAVWHFCHVMSEAEIGADCSFGQNCFVAKGVRVGRGCRVQNNVSLYQGVELEDDVFVGPSAVFTNVLRPRAFVSQKDAYAATRVRRGATIGANATVLPGLTVGSYSFVAAGATVTADVPDFALVAGVPARRIGWVSRRGVRLTFDAQGSATCPESGESYRLDGERVSAA